MQAVPCRGRRRCAASTAVGRGVTRAGRGEARCAGERGWTGWCCARDGWRTGRWRVRVRVCVRACACDVAAALERLGRGGFGMRGCVSRRPGRGAWAGQASGVHRSEAGDRGTGLLRGARKEKGRARPACTTGKERGKGKEKKEKEKKMEKRNGGRKREGERGIRAGITALIAEPVGHASRSPACADEATKKSRDAGDRMIRTGKGSGE